ncbi:MAG: VTT domain-containing protein [Bdellovibrionales bacterium]|nr:VTT domain-containing protein [Bdellovibrionales bacterium]
MFENMEQSLLSFLTNFAYDPWAFYSIIILLMTLTTFGVPISEEVVIISAALVTYMGAHPELYPPPAFAVESGQSSVQPFTTALVCFLSVFLSDLLVYMLGFIFRERIITHPLVKKYISQKRKEKIDTWVSKYGAFVSGIFRFTPGLRFIGYLTCGVVRIPIHKFILINGGVALLVVPSQVFIISIYGKAIVANLKFVSVVLLVLCAFFILTMLFTQLYKFFTKTK